MAQSSPRQEGANLRFIPYLIVLALVACADAPMVQVSPDTYLIARSDKAGIFGNAAAMKAKVIQEDSTDDPEKRYNLEHQQNVLLNVLYRPLEIAAESSLSDLQ